jgi:hypothetical protein
MTTLRVQYFPEDRRTIRSRKAQPVDRPLRADQCRNLTITDESVRVHKTTLFDFSVKVN